MKKQKYLVYKHTSPSNKVYIGITSKTAEERWSCGYGYRKNDHFNKAIQKYGWKNIKHEILYENLSREEAEQKEKELIAFYNSNNRNYGYNNDNGGLSGDSIKTEEEKRHQSEDKKLKWSIPEYREMVLEKLIAKHGLKVECIETGKKYKSLTEAGKDINGKTHTIKLCCEGIRETYKGYHWKYCGNNYFRNTKNYQNSANSKKVAMYDINGNLIKSFRSIEQASKYTGINTNTIRRRLKGIKNRKGQYDYIWKYYSEVVNMKNNDLPFVLNTGVLENLGG